MGAVFKAYDKELGRAVALKLVRPDLTTDPAILQRFKQELLLASRISHKNILRIHDLGDVGGVKFISMAYIEGEDLHHILSKGGPLSIEEALNITRQLCAALEAAHAEGVVHRDLKPQNILIDAAGNAYISDFGLAKSLEAGATMMTRSGELLGTPQYMSPEQAEGNPVDQRTDLYALGLILYEMVTGTIPFTGDSTYQVIYQRLRQKPKSTKLLNPSVPDYFDRVIMRCLERDPQLRYQQAREILADLEAERASLPGYLKRFASQLPKQRRRPLVVAVVAFFMAILLAIPAARMLMRRKLFQSAATQAGPVVGKQRYMAVLPVRILGDQASLEYVGQGIVEALSSKLFQLKSIHVAPASDVEKASKQGSLEKIAHELGADVVVQCTLQGSKDQIRLIINVEDVTTKRRLWSQEFPAVTQDLIALEDHVFSELVKALGLSLSNEELARGLVHPTESVEAYDLYLRGRNVIKGGRDPKNIQAAINYYAGALKKDSGFPLAYAGLADAKLQMYRLTRDHSWADEALTAAQQAARLNDSLPEAYFSLGSVYNATGRTAQAAAELKHALEISPNSDEGYRRLGENYMARGQKDEAIQAYQRAIKINPYYWVNYNSLGNAYYQIGEYEKALAAYRRMTELDPGNVFGYQNIGSVYLQQAKYGDSVSAFQKALELQPNSANYSNLGVVYFYLGRYDESAKMFEKAVEMNPQDQQVVGNLADAYRWSGQREKSLGTYDRAIALAYGELQVNPRKASTMGNLALYYAKKGDARQALSQIRRARSIDRNDVDLIYTEAVVAALADRPREALMALREAFQRGYSPDVARKDPELRVLRSRPEFEALTKEFGGKRS